MRAISEDAVSPVIGVMLMITVTIIVAAVVAAFVGGASTQFEKTPQTSMRVYCDWSEDDLSDFNIIFEHLSGDPLRTQDLRIVTWIKDGNKVIKNETSGRSPLDGVDVRVPYVYDAQSGVLPKYGFGEATWKRGTRAGTDNIAATAFFLGIRDKDYPKLPKDVLKDFIDDNTPVEVTIVHIPSGNTILQSEFILGR